MHSEKILWGILAGIVVLIMGYLGYLNYMQIAYNPFIGILLVASAVLVIVVWRKGVDIKVSQKWEPGKEE